MSRPLRDFLIEKLYKDKRFKDKHKDIRFLQEYEKRIMRKNDIKNRDLFRIYIKLSISRNVFDEIVSLIKTNKRKCYRNTLMNIRLVLENTPVNTTKSFHLEENKSIYDNPMEDFGTYSGFCRFFKTGENNKNGNSIIFVSKVTRDSK